MKCGALILCCLCFLLSSRADVRLEWDANPPEENVIEYVVHWYQPGGSLQSFSAGNNTSADISAIVTGAPWTDFYVIAWNAEGLSSQKSTTIRYSFSPLPVKFQTSTDLVNWFTLFEFPRTDELQRYFRISQ